MVKESAGILLYRRKNKDGDRGLEVFLVHPGGPFWKNKDSGAWSIPKGEIESGDNDALERSIKEVEEETGIKLPDNESNYIDLESIKQNSGKTVYCFAIKDEGYWKGMLLKQSYIEVEWPPKSGKKIRVPEVDKADFFPVQKAKEKINQKQKKFIDRLEKYIYGNER